MTHGACHPSDGWLFVQISRWIFLTERLDWQNMISYNHFLLYNKQKKNQTCTSYRKLPRFQIDVHWKWPALCSCSEKKQLTVYQLLPNLAIWEHFVWLSSGSEPVNMWAPLQNIHRNSRALATTIIFSVIISISLITTLEKFGCYILLLPASKVEMWVKRQLSRHAGDYFKMRVTHA